ncbi:MAG TPA: hypothetical protein VIJ12_00480 [Candidatus Baltobacteraceae bacterium]
MSDGQIVDHRHRNRKGTIRQRALGFGIHARDHQIRDEPGGERLQDRHEQERRCIGKGRSRRNVRQQKQQSVRPRTQGNARSRPYVLRRSDRLYVLEQTEIESNG